MPTRCNGCAFYSFPEPVMPRSIDWLYFRKS